MLKVIQSVLWFWINLVFVTSLSRIFISTPFGFLDACPVEKLLSGESSSPSIVLLKHYVFYNMYLTFKLKHVYQNVKKYSASVLSLWVWLLIKQYISSYTMVISIRKYKWQITKILESSVQASILQSIISLGKLSY